MSYLCTAMPPSSAPSNRQQANAPHREGICRYANATKQHACMGADLQQAWKNENNIP